MIIITHFKLGGPQTVSNPRIRMCETKYLIQDYLSVVSDTKGRVETTIYVGLRTLGPRLISSNPMVTESVFSHED